MSNWKRQAILQARPVSDAEPQPNWGPAGEPRCNVLCPHYLSGACALTGARLSPVPVNDACRPVTVGMARLLDVVYEAPTLLTRIKRVFGS
jgi:hypothetical protein